MAEASVGFMRTPKTEVIDGLWLLLEADVLGLAGGCIVPKADLLVRLEVHGGPLRRGSAIAALPEGSGARSVLLQIDTIIRRRGSGTVGLIVQLLDGRLQTMLQEDAVPHLEKCVLLHRSTCHDRPQPKLAIEMGGRLATQLMHSTKASLLSPSSND